MTAYNRNNSLRSQAELICGGLIVALSAHLYVTYFIRLGFFDEIGKAIWFFFVITTPSWLIFLFSRNKLTAWKTLGALSLFIGASYIFTGGWSDHA